MASPQEGEAIVQAAWELRRGLNPKPDCSHFVHAIYTHAGFLYEYAASRDIFAGIEHFRRVTKPQPGDVIVWQGHIGIVIDPKEHSFYSSVISGFAIESYKSHYWMLRGIPRFYRFVVNDSPGAPPPLFNLALISTSGEAPSNLTTISPVQPAILTHSSTSKSSAKVAAEGPAIISAKSSAIVSAKSSAIVSAQVQPLPTQQRRAVIEDRPIKIQARAAATKDTQTSDQALVTSRATPSKEEVLAAILRSIDANSKRLVQGRSLDSQRSVSVVDTFRVVAINLQGNSGLADLEVKQMARFQYGKAIPMPMTTRRNVILSRQDQGWVLVMPQDLMCLNRYFAVIALTDHLSTLTGAPANSPERKTSLRILNELVSSKSSGGLVSGSD